MALVLRSYTKVASFIVAKNLRYYSMPVEEKDIKKSVFISQSKDIYSNLALEDWLYRNFDFKRNHVLMLWQNDPCVVIGRHQNPWLEANLSEFGNSSEGDIQLARRNSGGGTVFHDNGNLNLTFFTAREQYNRKYNLGLITRSLFREYGIKVDISKKDDLTVRNYKISGTAAKLGRSNAYHHCTLLVEANKVNLSLALQKQEVDIETNATKSVKSKIMNLCEENPNITMSKLMEAIGWEYMRTPAFTLTDQGMELAYKQNGFQMINPSDQWFPGWKALRDEYASWDWCYGKTPKFNISRIFKIPDSLVNSFGTTDDLKVTMVVEKGLISDITLRVPSGFVANVVTSLIGHRFSEDALNTLEQLLRGLDSDKDRFVTECLKKVMTSV